MKNEKWKAHPVWDRYELSSFGRIRKSSTKVVRKPYLTTTGYLYIVVRKNKNKKKAQALHRLVAETFIKNKHNKEQVAHLDGIKTNNFSRNLRWVTRSENEMQKVLHGTSNRGENHRIVKLKEAEVRKIISMIKKGVRRGDIARKFNINNSHVYSIHSKRSWGWLW